MSEKARSIILLIFGFIGVAGTIGTQVLSAGRIEGTVMTMIKAHDQRLESHDRKFEQHDTKLNAAELQIERIKGRVGIAGRKPDSSSTASNPPCIETETEQKTH